MRYFSVAGHHRRGWLTPNWWLPGRVVEHAEGPNDGVVSLASAAWGETRDVWEADHMELVNWPRLLAARSRSDERVAGYVNLVRRLLWGGHDAQGKLVRTIRVTEEREYADVEDRACTLEGVAAVVDAIGVTGFAGDAVLVVPEPARASTSLGRIEKAGAVVARGDSGRERPGYRLVAARLDDHLAKSVQPDHDAVRHSSVRPLCLRRRVRITASSME